ncbi:MAG TPA: phosphate acetyltransferase [Paracoccaceae bacterium]|nr:phosphate acetyltransferase [Paracoccaceae bacterium]
MSFFNAILDRARATRPRIVLPEGEDTRIIAGALRAATEGLARPILLGRVERIKELVGDDRALIEILDPRSAPRAADYAAAYHELRRHRGIDRKAAERAMADPMSFAAMMVRQGDAAGTVGGAVATTAETVRAALQIIGRATGIDTVSSFFLMILDKPHHPIQGALVFADCALIVEPSVNELATIAAASADSFQTLTAEEPRVAMLSFSTHGSASHPRIDRVKEALALLRDSRPDLVADGELQFDAAFVPEIGRSKARDSPLEGRANVFVFPSLEAANIGYKIAQRIGGVEAIGPILQGLAHPANDLSRGCSEDDVYRLIAITAAQADAGEDA